MKEDRKIDIVSIFVNEIERRNHKHLEQEKLFIQMKKGLCNDVLYNDKKHKKSVIILTNIFNILMIDFMKEVNDCINKVGAYKDE